MGIREQILAAEDLPTATVELPEWLTTLTVRTLTVGERADLEMLTAGLPAKDIMAHWVAAATYDQDGGKVFDANDVPRLLGKASAPMLSLFGALARLNRIGKADVEELAKN